MKRIKITARAVRFIDECTKRAEEQIGSDFVPVIMWQVDDSGASDFVPHLVLGFENRDAIDHFRIMECEGEEVEIYQYVPDELFGKDADKIVDVQNSDLIFSEET